MPCGNPVILSDFISKYGMCMMVIFSIFIRDNITV